MAAFLLSLGAIGAVPAFAQSTPATPVEAAATPTPEPVLHPAPRSTGCDVLNTITVTVRDKQTSEPIAYAHVTAWDYDVADEQGVAIVNVNNCDSEICVEAYGYYGTCVDSFDDIVIYLEPWPEQTDTPTWTPTHTPTSTAIPTRYPDLDGSGHVDATDLLLFLKAWHRSSETDQQ